MTAHEYSTTYISPFTQHSGSTGADLRQSGKNRRHFRFNRVTKAVERSGIARKDIQRADHRRWERGWFRPLPEASTSLGGPFPTAVRTGAVDGERD